MKPKFVTIHRRAELTVDRLKPKERRAVWEKFKTLRNLPPERWPEEGVRRTKPDEPPVFIVPVTPDLFVYFSVVPENGFVLEDFVSRGRLEFFSAALEDSVSQA
jgi:hypothetical protein